MDPQKQREIASKGGKAAHQKGTAHEFTSDEARIAGRKGGAASRERRGKMASSGQQNAAPEASQEENKGAESAEMNMTSEGQSEDQAAENEPNQDSET